MAGVSLAFEDSAISHPLDGVESTITLVRALGEYPNGTKAPLLGVTFTPTVSQKPRTELFGLGWEVALKPSADGKEFEEAVKGNGARPTRNGAMMRFLQSLVAAGFSTAITRDVTVLEGTVVLTRAKGRPKTGKPEFDAKSEGKVDIYIEKVLAMPGEKPAAKATAAKKPAPVAAPKAATPAPAPAAAPVMVESTNGEAADYDAKAVEAVLGVLCEAPDGILARNRVQSGVFKSLTDAKVPGPERQKILGEMNKVEFFGKEGRPWFISGGNVRLTAEEAAAA